MTDEQAMWRVQMADDDVAFTRLMRRWESPIIRLCARMTGDMHRGEDLKQETFARVFAHRKDFKPDGKFSTWVWRIALNLCYDDLRKKGRRPELVGIAEEEEAGAAMEAAPEETRPDALASLTDDCETVRRALLRLPERNRAALVLRYCEGLKMREVAEVLQIPETTAASRVGAGLAQITRILEPQFTLSERLLGQPERTSKL